MTRQPKYEVVLTDASGVVVNIYLFFSPRPANIKRDYLNSSVASFVGGARASVRKVAEERQEEKKTPTG